MGGGLKGGLYMPCGKMISSIPSLSFLEASLKVGITVEVEFLRFCSSEWTDR
jgi:hypothetical protein